jgi:hypothetical protein
MTPASAPAWNYMSLNGNAHVRAQTLVLPSAVVASMLPRGMELGPQRLTPKGKHPLVLFFQDLSRMHMTIPTLLPRMTYNEQVVGIPFVRVVAGYEWVGPLGPFFYMPNLYLNDFLPMIGGRLFWGFNKQFAPIEVNDHSWTVRGDDRRVLISMKWRSPTGGWRTPEAFPHFAEFCQSESGIMNQPLVSMLPGYFQFFSVCSEFSKLWSHCRIRPIQSRVHIGEPFVEGLPTGSFPKAADWSAGIDAVRLGAFELQAPVRVSLPFPCSMASLWPGVY